MNVAIYPGMVVDRDTVVTAEVLNAGYSPTGSLLGSVESTDFGNGVLTSGKLAATIVSERGSELPTAQHRLWHQTGAQSGRTTIGEVPAVLPAYLLGEVGYQQAQSTTTTVNEDVLVLRTADGVARAPLNALTAGDVTTAGTYRAGQVTIDAKGRVLSTAPGNHWTTGWNAIPPRGITFTHEHTLGRQPAILQAWLKCIAAGGEAGYENGDIVAASALVDGTTLVPYLVYLVNATSLRVYGRAGSGNPRMARDDGATPTPITLAKWQLMINLKL